jgi:hypothetical protein
MDANGLNATSRQIVFALPFFMGGVEYLLRLALDQSDSDAFFPSSLAAAGVALFIALTPLPAIPDARSGKATLRFRLALRLAQAGIWAAVFGVAGWIYLVTASLSESVKVAFPYHPGWGSVAYAAFSVLLNEVKARMT